MRRLRVPLFLGKFVHNVLLALLFYAFASWSADHVSTAGEHRPRAARSPSLFMVLVGYHAEKARAMARGSAAEAGAEARPRREPAASPPV